MDWKVMMFFFSFGILPVIDLINERMVKVFVWRLSQDNKVHFKVKGDGLMRLV